MRLNAISLISISLPIFVLFSTAFIDFMHHRYLPGEKIFKGFLLILMGLYFLSSKRIILNNTVVSIIIFLLFALIVAISRGEGLRDISGAVVLYGLPTLFYLYFNSNENHTKLFIDNLEKCGQIFLFFLLCAYLFMFLLGEVRFEARNPLLFALASVAVIKNFKTINILIFIILLFAAFSSTIRLALAVLVLSLIFSYLYLVRSRFIQITSASILFSIIALFLFTLTLLFFDVNESRYSTLLNLQFFDIEDFILNREYSTLTRYYEYESIIQFIERSTLFNIFFGHGLGATYPANDNLLYVASISGGEYQEAVIRSDGFIHNIHSGPLSTFFKFGFFGLFLYIYLFAYVLLDVLNYRLKNSNIFCIKLAMFILLIQDLFSGQLHPSISLFVIPLYFVTLDKKYT